MIPEFATYLLHEYSIDAIIYEDKTIAYQPVKVANYDVVRRVQKWGIPGAISMNVKVKLTPSRGSSFKSRATSSGKRPLHQHTHDKTQA